MFGGHVPQRRWGRDAMPREKSLLQDMHREVELVHNEHALAEQARVRRNIWP